jgi:hypothetical protein
LDKHIDALFLLKLLLLTSRRSLFHGILDGNLLVVGVMPLVAFLLLILFLLFLLFLQFLMLVADCADDWIVGDGKELGLAPRCTGSPKLLHPHKDWAVRTVHNWSVVPHVQTLADQLNLLNAPATTS